MTRALIILASFVVILAGIKAASSLVVPFLLAIFLAIVLAPPFVAMQKRGIPNSVVLVVMVIGLGTFGVLAVTVMKSSLDQFTSSLPAYEIDLRTKLEALFATLAGYGIEMPKGLIANSLDPQSAMKYAGNLARALSVLIGQSFIILIIVIFMLMEATVLERKLHAIPNIRKETIAALEQNFLDVRRYVSLKSVMSLLTGLLVGIWLWWMDVDNILFMAVLAFFLNFVPNIGSIIAAIPGVLLAFIQFGPSTAAIVAGGYIVINVGISNAIEPRFMGRGLGISPLVIIISLIFWGWLIGPVGMLLSVPLTMAVKILLEQDEKTRYIATFLGPRPVEKTNSD
jgi:predicted PurR-regulated permease PerM